MGGQSVLQKPTPNAATPASLPGGWAGGVKGMRRAEFTFAGGGNSQFSGNLVDSHQRLLFKLPVATTRWRLRIGNNMPDGTLTSGACSVTGVYLGTPVVDSTGAPTGAFTAAPTSVIAPFSTNADGSDLRTAWITASGSQIAANTLAGLSIGWTATSGQVIQNGGAKMWYSTGTGKNADAATAAPALSTAQTTAFNIAIEYEFAGTNQVGLVIGDSLTDGYFTSATLLALDTYHQNYSQRASIPIITTADYGSNANEWVTLSQERWQRILASGHTIDFAVVDLGSNDANNGATLAAFQGYVSSIVANVRSLGINRIYFNTIAPRALTGTNETNRVAFNTWLASRPFGIRGVFDVEALLADPAALASLRSGYAGSDTVHWSQLAHQRASLAWAPIG